MKALLGLLLSLGAATLVLANGGHQCDASITAQCPFPDGPNPIFLPVPENCREYCECSDGIAWLFVCAPGTLFDAQLGLCNWEDLVDCYGRPTPLPPTDLLEDSSEEDEYDSW
ncbi:uncharacterized protein [Panulirus ornatus]|uniref:uncharacterized protein n=1 Tax=Panulirus ornatus TaxID=150431 RepID=UPI003A87A974